MIFDPIREFDQVVQRAFGTTGAVAAPMDVYRRDDVIHVEMDLPGITEDSIDLTVEPGLLRISAHRPIPSHEGADVLLNQRAHGPIAQELHLGRDVDTAAITADYDRGVLSIRIPLAEEAKPRRISVGGGQTSGSSEAIDAESSEAIDAEAAA